MGGKMERKYTFRKLLLSLLVIIMIFTATACKNDKVETESKSPKSNQETSRNISSKTQEQFYNSILKIMEKNNKTFDKDSK